MITILSFIIIGTFDKQLDVKDLLELPQVYCTGIYNTLITIPHILLSCLAGIISAILILSMVYSAIGDIMCIDGLTESLDLTGFCCYIIMYVTFTLILILYTNSKNKHTIRTIIVNLSFSVLIILLLSHNIISNDRVVGVTSMLYKTPVL